MAKADKDDPEAWMAKVRVPQQVIILFTRQLAIMLRTGVPMLHALDTLSHQDEYPNFGEVVATVAQKIGEGHSFSATLSKFPRVFSKVYVTMASIGEKTGHLDDSLERLAGWQEKDYTLYQKVRGALTYPCFIMGLSFALTMMLFYWVLPGFLGIFDEMDIELPVMTKIMIRLTNAAKNPGAWILGIAIIGFSITLIRDLYKTEKGAVEIFRFLSAVPMLGTMLTFATISRYCAAVSALLNSGLDLPKTLTLSAHASGSPVLAHDSKGMVQSIMDGEPVSVYMGQRPDIYPMTLIHMVTAGEEASHLPSMFERVAIFYESEVSYKIETLSAALEPLMLGSVALVVGFIVLSIFIPMYSYLGQLGV